MTRTECRKLFREIRYSIPEKYRYHYTELVADIELVQRANRNAPVHWDTLAEKLIEVARGLEDELMEDLATEQYQARCDSGEEARRISRYAARRNHRHWETL